MRKFPERQDWLHGDILTPHKLVLELWKKNNTGTDYRYVPTMLFSCYVVDSNGKLRVLPEDTCGVLVAHSHQQWTVDNDVTVSRSLVVSLDLFQLWKWDKLDKACSEPAVPSEVQSSLP